MILVKIKLNKSKIHGIGCFANEFIKKDQLVWKFDKNFDLVLKKEYVDSLPIGAKENFLNYAYISKTTGDYILCSDDSKFMNHSNEPNIKCIIPEGCKTDDLICFAIKDIEIDEEIISDYKDFDADPYDVV